MRQSPPPLLSGLNGLRAIACLSVLFYHLNQHRPTANLAQWNWDFYQFVETWPVNVSLFFMLSAVLSSIPFWRSIFLNVPPPSAREFLINRFFRIAPAYYVALASTFVLVLILNGYQEGVLIRLAAGVTFLTWLHPFTFFPVDINGPLWYIPYDMMGVLLVVGVMSLLVRVRKPLIPLVMVSVGGMLVLLHLWFTALPFPVLPGIMSQWFPWYNPFIFGLHFLIGTAVAWALVWQEKHEHGHSLWYDLLFTLVSGGLLIFLWNIREAGDFDYTWLHGAHRFPFATVPIALMVFLAPRTEHIWKWLDNTIFHTVARLSYSVYLWHAVIIALMLRFAFSGAHDLLLSQWFVLVGTTIVWAFALAWLSYTYIEMPVSNWWRVRSERKRCELGK